MATATSLSLGITATGVKVIVPHHDLAFLMYYLRCVTLDIGHDTLDEDLIDYEHYWRLSNERRDRVIQYAQQYSPQELIDKVIFRDDEGVITKRFKNEFCEVSVACGIVSIQRDVFIAGRMQSVSKVMFYKQAWLDEHYNLPIKNALASKWHLNPYYRASTLYLAPLFYLTALLLSLFAYLSPVVILHDQVALLTITPSAQSGPVDGIRLFLGALGSCSKENSTTQVQCTKPKFNPAYDLSALPSSALKISISPHASSASLIGVSIGFILVFFVLYILIAFSGRMGKTGRSYDDRSLQKLTAWIGGIGFIIGIPALVSLRHSLWNSAQSFNGVVQDPQYKGPQLIARTANGFIMLWIAYGFYAPVFVMILVRLVTQGKGSFWRL